MSVRIARLANGEDVIANIQGVFSDLEDASDEEKTLMGWQFDLPYSIKVISITAETGNRITKVSEPELYFQPWAPLSADPALIIRFDEVVSVYNPHQAVLTKYQELIEAQSNG